MKIRFVLNPFSFVFLLSERTNILLFWKPWTQKKQHIFGILQKTKHHLIEEVKQIDNQLNIIREKGRQTFLENSPENFTRIIHDYSDNKKGFIIWKSAIEELI
ncbi:MAG: hypothetical protein U5K51_08160 [Flavobacteriaceae bacterium]|nr:hypothetical protein [Flavobacteriaceae bacterium]